VYQLLGFENADVIISAHGFVIRDPRVFPEYIGLLKGQPSGSIEIRRGGSSLLLAITIKD
jgi:type II secretory pathway component PulC